MSLLRKIKVRAQPRAKKILVQEITENDYKVYLNTPPVDGKANEALIEILAKHFKISKSRFSILQGQSSRDKVIGIEVDSL